MPEPNQQQLNIRVKDDDLKGAYSNAMQVSHSKEEFILDFFLTYPPEGVLSSRVIVSPGHFKNIIRALQENLGKYEEKFGKIAEVTGEQPSIGFHK